VSISKISSSNQVYVGSLLVINDVSKEIKYKVKFRQVLQENKRNKQILEILLQSTEI